MPVCQLSFGLGRLDAQVPIIKALFRVDTLLQRWGAPATDLLTARDQGSGSPQAPSSQAPRVVQVGRCIACVPVTPA
jgi:hypothetical protein